MNTALTFILAVMIFMVVWRVFSRRKRIPKQEVYVCDQCGESHCDCHREKEHPTVDKT